MANQATDETTDSKASHRALTAITSQLRTAAQNRSSEVASEAVAKAYQLRMEAYGGDTNHQGWSCDLDPANDWWMVNPNASDAEWLAELATWGWIDEDGEWHEREDAKFTAKQDGDRTAAADRAEHLARTLTTRMAMMAWHIAALDEDSAATLFTATRENNHAAIAQLIRADHTMTDIREAEAMIRSIYAGGEAG